MDDHETLVGHLTLPTYATEASIQITLGPNELEMDIRDAQQNRPIEFRIV